MSILSVFDVLEVIWTPQNTYLINKMVSNSRVTRTGVVGRAVWLFFTRVRSINWCPLLRVTIRTSIAAWSQGLRLTGRDIELCTRFDTPNSPELTPTSNSRVTRTGVVDHVVWLFCKSTVDRLISTLESDYYDVHRGLRSGFVSNRSGCRVMYTFWHPWTPPKYLKKWGSYEVNFRVIRVLEVNSSLRGSILHLRNDMAVL